VTLINGKKVPIVRAKVIKATKKTKDLLKKADKGIIKSKELKELRRRLKTETGFTPSLSRTPGVKPRVRLPIPKVPRVRARPKPRKPTPRKPARPKPRKPTPRKPARPKPRRPVTRRIVKPPIRKPIPRRIVKPPRRPTRRVPPRRPIRPPIRPGIIPPRLKKPSVVKITKRKQGYDVYARPLKRKGAKKIPKLIKINKVPISKQRAEDLRNYIIDTSLARTGKIKPSGKMQKPRLKVPSSYGSKTKYKFRTYKIRKKKRVPLKKHKVIEKRKRLLDTPQEKKQISLARRLAQIEKKSGLRPTKRKVVRKVRRTPIKSKRKVIKRPKQIRRTARQHVPVKRTTQRRTPSQTQLRNLARGRRIRMENLKKRKR